MANRKVSRKDVKKAFNMATKKLPKNILTLVVIIDEQNPNNFLYASDINNEGLNITLNKLTESLNQKNNEKEISQSDTEKSALDI